MNVIKISVEFDKNTCTKSERMLITGDYNSTKLEFEFDREEGIKVFELKDPEGNIALVKEITDGGITLTGTDEEGKFYSIFQMPGEYIFEISLYDGDSKLTSMYNYLQVQEEQVIIGDEVVQGYLPIFDDLLNKIAEKTQYAQEQGDYAKGVGEQLEKDKEAGLFKGEKGDKGDKGDKGEPGDITPEELQKIADQVEEVVLQGIDDKIQAVEDKIPDVSNFITNTVDNLVNYYRKDETYNQEEINERISKIPKMHFEKVDRLPDIGDEDTIYLVPTDSPSEQNECEEYIWLNGKFELIGTTKIDLSGIEHDIENLTELIKELQDKGDEIYVGYISSVTPSRNAIEVIIENAIKSGASTLMLRPTPDLPQDFTAIGSGPNLQKYKNGGRGSISFTDINEHTTINAMPSVVSYITTVSFTVTSQDNNVDVEITDVSTKFISGINSTSQQAYVIHTKNEEPYTPTKDYHPATKKYIDDLIASSGGGSGSSNVYYFDGDINSEDNKDMFDEIYDKVQNNIDNVIVIYRYSDGTQYNRIYYLISKQIQTDVVNMTEKVLEITFFRAWSAIQYSNYGITYDAQYKMIFSYNKAMRRITKKETIEGLIDNTTMGKIISKDNTSSWTPVQNYGLVHKKYVDDSINDAIGDVGAVLDAINGEVVD